MVLTQFFLFHFCPVNILSLYRLGIWHWSTDHFVLFHLDRHLIMLATESKRALGVNGVLQGCIK